MVESKSVSRTLEAMLWEHFLAYRQMLFVMGPRQVGKTTLAHRLGKRFPTYHYLNWDHQSDRQRILGGPDAVAGLLELERLRADKPLCVLDEIHKYSQWKTFLKGFFDHYADQLHFLVTGSARLDTFKAGGDSLMGRYFTYRLHPLSLAEQIGAPLQPESLIQPPRKPEASVLPALLRFGGFPEPFLHQDSRFWQRWRRLRTQQLLQEDLRDLSRVQEISRVEVMATLLRQRAGQLVSYSSLASHLQVSVDTVRRWIDMLSSLYYCYPVRPWFNNVARALRKESKYYLWDWSQLEDIGAKAENLIASALLKAVDAWTDAGYGDFSLHFLRDKEKREVDFLVVRDGDPWFLAEVKANGKTGLSPALEYFQQQTKARHAFQIALDLPYVERDCFEITRPVIVPAATFLSQLV